MGLCLKSKEEETRFDLLMRKKFPSGVILVEV